MAKSGADSFMWVVVLIPTETLSQFRIIVNVLVFLALCDFLLNSKAPRRRFVELGTAL